MRLDKIIAVRTDKTVYKDGDNVIKIFNGNYSKVNILNEAMNLAKVEEVGLNVPNLLEVTKIDGKWAIITKYIHGKTLETVMKENPSGKEEYMNLFVDIQKEIIDKNVHMLGGLKEKMRFSVSSADMLTADTKEKLLKVLDILHNGNCICHGDFNPSNIIMSENKNAYVLDWSHVTAGNPAADAAWSYLLFLMSGEKDNAETYIDLFCKKTGIEKKNITECIPVVAASHLSKSNENGRKFLFEFIK